MNSMKAARYAGAATSDKNDDLWFIGGVDVRDLFSLTVAADCDASEETVVQL